MAADLSRAAVTGSVIDGLPQSLASREGPAARTIAGRTSVLDLVAGACTPEIGELAAATPTLGTGCALVAERTLHAAARPAGGGPAVAASAGAEA